jgi:hypothetical protein
VQKVYLPFGHLQPVTKLVQGLAQNCADPTPCPPAQQ